jgi:F-type H+-transporting ATPase subunit delta
LQDGVLQLDRAIVVIKALTEKKPRGYLPILTRFKKLLSLELFRRTALIESPESLDPSVRASVEADLKKIYGALYHASEVVRPELLGGLRIRVGSDVVDGTVHGRLQQLARNFSN